MTHREILDTVVALFDLAEAATEAVYGCESEITGERLEKLTAALGRVEATGLLFPVAAERGRNS